MKILKYILIQLAVGANVMSALLLLVCALSSYLNPADYPKMALLGLSFPILLLLNLAFILFWLIFSVRYVWVPFVGMLFSLYYIYDYCPVNISEEKPENVLKLLTYNTNFFGQGEVDAKGDYPVLDYLTGSEADIVCIQEGNPWGKLTLKEVDDAMKKRGYNIRRLDDGRSEFLSVYSRLPVLSVERVTYKTSSNGSIAVKLLYEKDTILLINNHFESYKLTREDKIKYKELIKDPENDQAGQNSKALLGKMAKASGLRGPQVDSVINYIKKENVPSVIVCGDFNESPISYSCRRLSSMMMSSAYRQSGNGLGLSYNQSGFYFRIDHIFVSDDWQTYDTYVDKSAVWSDHYPLITYLKKREN